MIHPTLTGKMTIKDGRNGLPSYFTSGPIRGIKSDPLTDGVREVTVLSVIYSCVWFRCDKDGLRARYRTLHVLDSCYI